MRATIDWSHELLSDDEKACFARFAVFVGGATVEAAETITVADLDTLDRLVAKSLLGRRQHGRTPTRLAMLETIRAYSTERFATAADQDAVRERHYRYFLALARRHGSDRALWGARGKDHLALLDAEISNLHAALAWAVGQNSAEQALAMCVATGRYWLMRDRYADALDWIDRVLSVPGADAYPALRTRALCDKAWCLWPLGRGAERRTIMDEAEAIARQLAEPGLLSHVLETRAQPAAAAGRLDVAATLADEALHWAKAAGDDWAIAVAAEVRALAAGSADELREHVDRAAALLDEAGNVYILAELLSAAAYQALRLGSDRDARQFVERAIPLARELDNPYGSMVLQGNYGLAALLTGDADTAREAFRDELRLCRELRVLPVAAEGLLGLAAIAEPATTRTAPPVSSAPPLHTPMAANNTTSRPGSTQPSSTPPAHATAPTTGTPPPATAAHSGSKTRSPTPSKNRPHRSARTAEPLGRRGAAPAQLDALRGRRWPVFATALRERSSRSEAAPIHRS
jgi:tetratricopeptide (TPR) repeat protein